MGTFGASSKPGRLIVYLNREYRKLVGGNTCPEKAGGMLLNSASLLVAEEIGIGEDCRRDSG